MKTTILTAAALLILTGHTTAQTAAPAPASAPASATPTPKPRRDMHTHYENRIQQIEKDITALPPDTTGTIVMVGDSITEGFFKSGLMPESISGLPIVNHGISGDQIDRPTSGTGVTHRIDLIADSKPAVIFVMIGVNDFWGGKETPEEVLPQYEKMFKMVKGAVPNARIVWQSVLPTSMKNAYLNENVDKLNNHIKELATQSGDLYLDLHPVMEDDKGQLKAEFTGDGVHLKPAAYEVWLQKIHEVLDGELQPKL